MASIRVIVDARKVKKTLTEWDKIIGLESSRLPKETMKRVKKSYLIRTSRFRWAGPQPTIKGSTRIITNPKRKTASLLVDAPHALAIERGMRRHAVSLKSPRSANQERLWLWLHTKGVDPEVLKWATKHKKLWVGGVKAHPEGAFAPSVSAGGGPMAKSFKASGVFVERRLKEIAKRLK
jgi:hypothetical protein